MPTYVYKFIETDETIEVQQSFADETLTEYTHPETGARMPVKKVFLPVGVTFKGDGFYKTDSRSGAKRKSSAGNGDRDSRSGSESSGSDTAAASSGTDGSSSSSSSSESSSSSSASSSSASTSSSND